MLDVHQNKTLRGIFGPKRDANWECRGLHNEELHCLCRSPNIVRVIVSIRGIVLIRLRIGITLNLLILQVMELVSWIGTDSIY